MPSIEYLLVAGLSTIIFGSIGVIMYLRVQEANRLYDLEQIMENINNDKYQ
jgi:hypothetical protein